MYVPEANSILSGERLEDLLRNCRTPSHPPLLSFIRLRALLSQNIR